MSAKDMFRYPSTGISILIVGGGMGGLTAAIECYRKGHDVRVFEGRSEFKPFGDILGIGTSALQSMKHWPGFLERFRALSLGDTNQLFKYDGTLLGKFHVGIKDVEDAVSLLRAEGHAVLHAYTRELGIPIEFSRKAVEFFERGDKGGVILESGEEFEADLVVAADGVGSKSWKLVMGQEDQPKSSGFAIYRTRFPWAIAAKDPLIREEFKDDEYRVSAHIGPDRHIVIAKTKTDISWLLTHRDNTNSSTESWSKTVSATDALPYLEGWAPFLPALVKCTPENTTVDWKLMWRNPQPKWTSPEGRVVQLGDAAHAFLPTSASGGTMAMEDAYALAACLQLSGKNNIPLGVRVYNKLRFERASCAQKTGFKNREKWHKTDWDAVASNPSEVGDIVGRWILLHDPEKYVYENYGKCVNHLIAGTEFENTNLPPGYVYTPWNIDEVLQNSEEGRKTIDAGDWS